MTTHIRYGMICSCGHSGFLKVMENDQPYSKMYESYSLEGFDGGCFNVDGCTDFETALAAIKPVCLKCGASLGVENVDKS